MKVPEPKKLPSGNYFVNMRCGGVNHGITATTYKECKRAAELYKAEYNAGKRAAITGDITLREACKQYIENNRSRLKESTISGYEEMTRNRFQHIMDVPINKITWRVLDDAIGVECGTVTYKNKKISPKTVHNAAMFIKTVLTYNKVRFDDKLNLPELQDTPIQVPTAEEVYRAVKGSPIELYCLLAMWMSYSISEIRGFTKSKSICNGQLSVVETVVDVHGVPVRKVGGKEEKRPRTQNIPPYIQSLIDKVDGDIICPMSGVAVNKRLTNLLKKAGVPHISFHKLRHIFASTATALNVPPAYIKAKGGWKTNYTMERVYTHTFTAERLAVDKKMDDYFTRFTNVNENVR